MDNLITLGLAVAQERDRVARQGGDYATDSKLQEKMAEWKAAESAYRARFGDNR